ncbi:hypothetical protein [Methylobacterium planeticum]|uniref:Uncharacterized protein n=1 Tax=Methylobacterium planeticum TaxID=2615211 RepID=A0A6N6MNU8_9HYPH|nr:hypothetical protein [Methylobacterium planeticum]KAB1071584.1 hypothetical protein F6X51_18610 [Methylobacterium planeticum]
MADNPTTEELLEAEVITWDRPWQAIEMFVADPEMDSLNLGASYSSNVHAAIDASVLAKDLLLKPSIDDHLKRAAVRTAILLARPEKRT